MNTLDSFLQNVRDTLRRKHLSLRTEEAYLYRIKQFIHFHDRQHPERLGADDIRAYLTHLAVHDHVSASTQNIARSALMFLYREVLEINLPLHGIEPAKRPERLPTVLTRAEVKSLLTHLTGTHHLMASLLYGAGLRLMDCVRLFTPLQSAANRGASKTSTSP